MGDMQDAQFYNVLVTNGQMSLEEASQRLSEGSGGGLTPLGARSIIEDPVKAGVRLANLADSARAGLAGIEAERKHGRSDGGRPPGTNTKGRDQEGPRGR
jgi:hypothetical protein